MQAEWVLRNTWVQAGWVLRNTWVQAGWLLRNTWVQAEAQGEGCGDGDHGCRLMDSRSEPRPRLMAAEGHLFQLDSDSHRRLCIAHAPAGPFQRLAH